MPSARTGARAETPGARLSRRLLLRRALGASTIVWLPAWAACSDDDDHLAPKGDAATGDGGDAGGGAPGVDASATKDAAAAADAGPSPDAAIDAGSWAFDNCQPLITPLGAFYIANGGEGTRQDWQLPDLDAGDYRLVIDGEVATPLSLTLQELGQVSPQQSVLKTMQCVFGQRGTGVFRGVPARALLELAGIDRDRAVRVRFHGADGFADNLRLPDLYPTSEPAESLFEPLVALEQNGEPLSRDHGYPARLVLPDRFGFKNVKWLSRIEATTSDEPFGAYQQIGLASDEAVIPLNGAYGGQHRVRAGAPGMVTLCGQAQSGRAGIELVEISIDRGQYTPAHIVPLERLLAAEPSLREIEQVKRGFAYPFLGVATPFEHEFVASPGEHELRVRMTDRSGATAESRAVLAFDRERDAG